MGASCDYIRANPWHYIEKVWNGSEMASEHVIKTQQNL